MEETAQKPSESPGLLSKAIKWASFPVAAVSGLWVGRTHVRNAAYDNSRFMDAFFDIKNDIGDKKGYHTELKTLVHDAVKNEVLKREAGFNIEELTRPLREGQKKIVAERMEKIGLGSLGKQWKFNMRYQKQAALIHGMSVAGIAIGALLAISNNKTIQHLFSKHPDTQQSDQSPSV